MGINKKSVDTLGFKWSVFSPPRGTAQIRFRWDGTQVSISTGHKSPTALSPKQQVAKIREWMGVHPIRSRGEAEISEEIERFIRLGYEGRKRHTVKEAEGHLGRLKEVLAVTEVAQITKRLCEARKDDLRGEYSPKTWKNFLTTARKFLRWEISEGNLKSDPLANFRTPQKKEFGRRLSTWDLERYETVLKMLDPESREILQVIWETGIDSSDFFELRPKNIVQSRRPDGSKFWKLYKVREKAKSSEEVIDQPLSTRAAEIILPRLKSWWDLSRYVNHESFTPGFARKVKRAQEKAGLVPLDVKSIRHTFATRHAERYLNGEGGPPMEVLRQWMGHAAGSRTLERLYVHAKSSGLYMP
jgi:integrase